MELLAVVGDDARRFLAAMLQGMKPQHGQGGGVRMVENAEDAAFLAKLVFLR